ncbi:MAG TPA: hypothetical protein VM261_14930 [Kofleriaceae bacterium]|nr:hypothetical protein [Kofleriaceae bacterium]
MRPFIIGIALATLAACASTPPPTTTTTTRPPTPTTPPAAPEAPPGPRTYAVEVTSADPAYAPTATVSTDEAVHAGVAAVMHVDIRFPATAPDTLADGYTGFAVGHPGPVTFTAPDGVIVDPTKVRLRGEKAVTVTVTHEHVAFDARVTATAAGATPLSAEVRFALCDRTRCDVRAATLGWSIDVLP